MYYYYIIIILQAVCVLHALKKGNQNKWIWLIVFLPLVGCIAYLYTEVYSKSSLKNVNINVNEVLNPGSRIKKLEDELSVSDSFDNKVRLADAYLSVDRIDEAIEIYESTLKGIFSDNEHVIKQLVIAYYHVGRYDEAISRSESVKDTKGFNSSETHIALALSLEKNDRFEQADTEFKSMQVKFGNYKQRFVYGEFLTRQKRFEEAKIIFNQILDESSHLKGFEKKNNRAWFAKADQELRNMD